MNVSPPPYDPEPGDRQLLHRVALRDPEALLALYRRYRVRVFSLLLRMLRDRATAEEILQDTFQRLWDAHQLFDPDRGTLLSWLLTIARNLALDHRRTSSRRAAFHVYNDKGRNPGDFDGFSAPASLDQDVSLSVAKVLAELPREQRHAIELAYFEGLSHAELAARLQTSVGTVKSRIRLGLGKLREALRGWQVLR